MAPNSLKLLLLFISFWSVSFASPVSLRREANVVAPAAPPPWKAGQGEVVGQQAPSPEFTEPSVSGPAVITGTPTNYPTRITNVATFMESHEQTMPEPLGGTGFTVRHETTAKTKSTIEEWRARATSLPYQVKGVIEETTIVTAVISQYLTGFPPPAYPTDSIAPTTDAPYAIQSITSTATRTLADYSWVVEFSLTSFPTSFTKTYTSTTVLTISQVRITKVIVETITESWSAQPTSFPCTLTQRAVARTWQGTMTAPFGLRTFLSTFVIKSLPTFQPTGTSKQQASPGIQLRMANNEARLEKRYNSIFLLAYAFTTLPTNLPTTMSASSTIHLTDIYTLVGYNGFIGSYNQSVGLTTHLTETQYEVHASAPTSFPYSVTGSVVGTTTASTTVYSFSTTWRPPYPCGIPSAPPACPPYTPVAPGPPTIVRNVTRSETNTWTWTKVYHFSLTNVSISFPTTVTRVYTVTKATETVTTPEEWNFGGGPVTHSITDWNHPPLATGSSADTPTAAPGPQTTETSPTIIETTKKRTRPTPPPRPPRENLTITTTMEETVDLQWPTRYVTYAVTYIDVSTILEIWTEKPTSFPTTVTNTGQVSHFSFITFIPGGLDGTAVNVEKVFPTMVVGSVKEGLGGRPSNGSSLAWEHLPFRQDVIL